MTRPVQLQLLAKLDGWKSAATFGQSRYPAYKHDDGRFVAEVNLPRYLDDYNIIIALIKKQEPHIQNGVWDRIEIARFRITPAMMAQALLRELELWSEE